MYRNLLRNILQYGSPTLLWKSEDIARVKFRLSLVLRDQSRPTEADKFRKEAFEMRRCWEDQLPEDEVNLTSKSDKTEMFLFDFGVTLWHGRTTGIWGNGEVW